MSYIITKWEGGQSLMLTAKAGRWDLTAEPNEAIRFYDARSAAIFMATNDGLKNYTIRFEEDTNGG